MLGTIYPGMINLTICVHNSNDYHKNYSSLCKLLQLYWSKLSHIIVQNNGFPHHIPLSRFNRTDWIFVMIKRHSEKKKNYVNKYQRKYFICQTTVKLKNCEHTYIFCILVVLTLVKSLIGED